MNGLRDWLPGFINKLEKLSSQNNFSNVGIHRHGPCSKPLLTWRRNATSGVGRPRQTPRTSTGGNGENPGRESVEERADGRAEGRWQNGFAGANEDRR